LEVTHDFVNALREHTRYHDGKLYWTVRKGTMRVDEVCGGTSVDKNGYHTMAFNGLKTSLHRFIWMYHYGPFDHDIDHINGNARDNRIENLRKCSRSQNLMNRGKFKNSTSKYKGVYFRKDIKKWQASICIEGKTKHLGVFTCELAAHEAWVAAAAPHHGAFLRCD